MNQRFFPLLRDDREAEAEALPLHSSSPPDLVSLPMTSKANSAGPTASLHSPSSSDLVKTLSSYVERGFVLLQVSCPLCLSPLLRSPQGGKFCAACNMPVREEKEIVKKNKEPVKVPTAEDSDDFDPSEVRRLRPEVGWSRDSEGFLSLSANPRFQELQKEIQQHAETTEEHEESEAPATGSGLSPRSLASHMARLNNVSALLGQRMLSGWTLLGVHCPQCHCPLVKNKRSATPDLCECVACEGKFLEGEDGQAKSAGQKEKPKEIQQKEKPAVAELSSSEEFSEDEDDWNLVKNRLSQAAEKPKKKETENRQQESADVSGRLGALLLSGHTMLAEHCPNPACTCPLMRKKLGPKVCVQCGESTEEKQEEKQKQEKTEKPTQPSVSEHSKPFARSGFVANSAPSMSGASSPPRPTKARQEAAKPISPLLQSSSVSVSSIGGRVLSESPEEFSHAHKKPRTTGEIRQAQATTATGERTLGEEIQSTMALTSRVLLSQVQRLTGQLAVSQHCQEISTIAATLQTLSTALNTVTGLAEKQQT